MIKIKYISTETGKEYDNIEAARKDEKEASSKKNEAKKKELTEKLGKAREEMDKLEEAYKKAREDYKKSAKTYCDIYDQLNDISSSSKSETGRAKDDVDEWTKWFAKFFF